MVRMDLEKAFEIIYLVISAFSYYSIAQNESIVSQIIAYDLVALHIITIITKKGEKIVLGFMALFLTFYYLREEQSLICFITLQLTIVKYISKYLFRPTKRKFCFEIIQIACIVQLYDFQILLLLQLEYRLVYGVISFLLILDIVFAKLNSKIRLACDNVRQNPQIKIYLPSLTASLHQFFFLSIFAIQNESSHPFKRMEYINTHNLRGFAQIYGLFLGITIFILNNIYMFSIECSSYQFVRIYYTLLVIFLLPKIKKDTLVMQNFVQNGPIIDVWPISNFDLQQLDSQSQNLTKNQQAIILDVQNFTSQYIGNLCCFWSKFLLIKQDTYQIIKDNWGLILNSLLQTNKSILIKISNSFYIDDDEQQKFVFYPLSKELHSLYFLDLEKNELFVNFLEDYKELNQAIINQYNNQLFNFVIDIKVNYYEDSFLPLFIQNYKLFTNEQNIPRDSPSFQEFNRLKYSFVGPAISYLVLKKVTSKYYFAISSPILLNDLYY